MKGLLLCLEMRNRTHILRKEEYVNGIGTIERRRRVNNEAKERLRTIARKLLDVSFVEACDDASTEEEFQKAVDALVNHLMKVRKRSQALHLEKEMA